MVGIASCIEIVLIFLGDVWHEHIDQSLYCMVVGCRKALVPGDLDIGWEKQEKEKIWRSHVCKKMA